MPCHDALLGYLYNSSSAYDVEYCGVVERLRNFSILGKPWALIYRQKRCYACIVCSEALNVQNLGGDYLERGADMEAQDMQGGRRRTLQECEVHTRFGYLPMYFSALGDKMARSKKVIQQVGGAEGIPIYLYKKSRRLMLRAKTR